MMTFDIETHVIDADDILELINSKLWYKGKEVAVIRGSELVNIYRDGQLYDVTQEQKKQYSDDLKAWFQAGQAHGYTTSYTVMHTII